MKIFITILAFFIVDTLSVYAQKIDNQASVINFKVGNFGINNVKGTFNGMSGTFNFNPDQLESSSFDICIKASTINTDNNKRDTHLKSADFFEAEKYPNICYTSNSVSKTENGYITNGNLTMHGITKPVEIPFQFSNKTFTGHLEVYRKDYNIGEDTGTFMVANKIKIDITCVLK